MTTVDQKIGSSIISSRTMQEQLEYASQNSIYGVFSLLIYNNIEKIDRVSELIAMGAGAGITQKICEKQYHDNNHKVRSFFERNIYVNAEKKEFMRLKRETAAIIAGKATELVLKSGSRIAFEQSKKKDELILYTKLYKFLRFFGLCDDSSSNTGKGMLEVKKILNSFPVDDSVKKNILIKAENSTDELERINIDEGQKEAVAYYLYSIYCQKCSGFSTYSDQSLKEMYEVLGFSKREADELAKENKNKYGIISQEQCQYLSLSRRFVKELSLNLPNMDNSQVVSTIDSMSKFDPYDIRRTVVKKAGVGTAMTIGGVFLKKPQLVLNGLATALSIMYLDDDGKELTRKKLLNYGIDEKAIEEAFQMGKSLEKEADLFLSLAD